MMSPEYTTIPRLYGRLKLHKSDVFYAILLRPVVSFVGSPTYQITRMLKLYELKDTVMVSLDIVNFYTNIHVHEVLPIVDYHLKNVALLPIHKREILQLLNLSRGQNFFQFNNFVYKMDGLPVGNTLSPYPADLFIHAFESKHILSDKTLIIITLKFIGGTLMIL